MKCLRETSIFSGTNILKKFPIWSLFREHSKRWSCILRVNTVENFTWLLHNTWYYWSLLSWNLYSWFHWNHPLPWDWPLRGREFEKRSSSYPAFFWVHTLSFPGSSDDKESVCNAENLGSIPGSGRSPGEGIGNPL